MIYHIFVSGRVQGVGYRRFAQKKAESLSLQGWVRNLYDGRVEVFAAGAEEALDQFCEDLKKGPSFSSVLDVLVKTLSEESATLENGFKIAPDAEWK